jgi:hypothetical protein
MKLYKYCSANRIHDLKSRKIRFTQACEFNDPFDLAPTYDMLSQEDQSRFILEDIAEGGDGKSYSLTPKRQKLMMEATQRGFEFVFRRFQWLGGQFAVDNNLVANMQLSLTYGVLSLSEIHDSLLMWSHYGDLHRGFVIEFDTSADFFRPCFARRVPSFLLKVDYSDVRPHLSSTTLNRPEALTRKSTAWAYEREWRMIKFLSEADERRSIHSSHEVPRHDALPVHLYQFPELAVTAVFTGAKMRSDEYTALTDLVSTDPAYSHVRMHHMQQSANEYRLTTSPQIPGTSPDPEHLPQVVSARPMRV